MNYGAIRLNSLQMTYIHDNIIDYDWIEDLYAWDMMHCMKMSNRRFCENRRILSKLSFMIPKLVNELHSR